MRICLLIAIIFAAISCSDNQEKNIRQEAASFADSLLILSTYPKEIVGTWVANSLRVDVQGDSAYQIYVAKNEWQSKLNRQPFKTTFRENNTYQIDYLDLNDSLIEKRRGVWNIFGDTLLLIENEATYQYAIKMKRNHLQYQATLDWDDDQEVDDIYTQIDEKMIKKD